MHATRGKWLRAEPVAALYAEGRVVHVGHFPELEDQMCDFGADGLVGGRSPDRLDALVWALTDLMLDGPRRERARVWSSQGSPGSSRDARCRAELEIDTPSHCVPDMRSD